MAIHDKKILLVISGGIAAYKSLELIRLLRKAGADVTCILTEGGAQFVTPLSVAALSENNVYTDLFSLKDETEMGHIRLSREADLIVVAPASANTIAKLAQGLAQDLASTTLLAANKTIMIAPAMNHEMWEDNATQTNITTLKDRGVLCVGPSEGDMACGEFGYGRMIEPSIILAHVEQFFSDKPLTGKKVIVTAGPTFEPIDPVRFIGNRSSGKQGYAIAEALAAEGADVTLISGPVALKPPANMRVVNIETADQMLDAVEQNLPADIGVFTAAVADWKPVSAAHQKMKKRASGDVPDIVLQENPDILKHVSHHAKRPNLVIGFAAETENTLQNALSKRERKGCDWIIANQVGDAQKPVFGADHNEIILITKDQTETWPPLTKQEVALRLVKKIIDKYKY